MLERIVQQEVIIYVMGILVTFGVFAKLVSYFTVRRMVKEAGEIHKSNHRLMKLVKAKFEHTSMISDKVQNVEAFVDKYIYEYKVLGIRLGSWRMFPGKMLWIIGILGVFAIFESYRAEGMSNLFLEYMQWTGIYVMFLLLLSFFAEEASRLQASKNYMVEYLENVCISRYAKMNRAVEEQEKPEEEEVQEEPKIEEVVTHEEKNKEQEMRIRAILEEFLA